MRAWSSLLVGSAVYVAVVVWAAARLPADGVPLHFAADGAADRLGPRIEAITGFALIGVLMLAVGVLVVGLARWGPLTTVNVPHKEYWMRPERQPRLRRMLADDVGTAVGALLLYLSVLPVTTVAAMGADPPGAPAVLLWGPLAVLVGALVAGLRWLYRVRYVPERDRS